MNTDDMRARHAAMAEDLRSPRGTLSEQHQAIRSGKRTEISSADLLFKAQQDAESLVGHWSVVMTQESRFEAAAEAATLINRLRKFLLNYRLDYSAQLVSGRDGKQRFELSIRRPHE
jgi:hypothetical protein